MTISYNWLSEYLPEKMEPQKLAKILTSIGLEVESLEKFEDIKGGLEGLIVGEVISCEKHPDADKLKITTVNTGNDSLLNIVCGAANVAAGQKVVVAPVGITIYPINGEPLQLRKAKIRGVESEGMICAEDEIGLGNDHNGIMILPADTVPGTSASIVFQPYSDYIFEIGLTPNRMDAMSHLGVAKDICAWLSYHNKKQTVAVSPYPDHFKPDTNTSPIEVIIENTEACKRYSGVCIHDINIADSPEWLQQHLKSIGLKPINNIVDITNFILQETGQPLHAFDADKISGNIIIVKNVEEGTAFKTLDDKERKLSSSDLMICNVKEPMCIAGVYGGAGSGVSKQTKNIFLESAWFNTANIRKTSVRHDLRTDAASRFEKGTDISNTVNVLKRAALLIKEIAGGTIADITDVYPNPIQKTTVGLKNHYLKKLSGKHYHGDDIKNILKNLGFEISKEGADEIWVLVPFSKPDISLPADIVEEIMRINGLDNVDIPSAIMISPSVEKNYFKYRQKEKLADNLTGLGFHEIFTNSITNSDFYEPNVLENSVKMINSLSAELNILRPQMMQGGLQVISHNINRRNENLMFYEFGKTYSLDDGIKYREQNHLSLYVSGNSNEQHWQVKPHPADFYDIKGMVEYVLRLTGIKKISFEPGENTHLQNNTVMKNGDQTIGNFGEVDTKTLSRFDIKRPVFYADINWDMLLEAINTELEYKEISKFPAVTRDLSMVVDKNVSYNEVEKIALSANMKQLRSVKLFDVFESEKIGAGKKSMALSFIFIDELKTLTDKEIDTFIQKIITACEKAFGAVIRK